MYTLPNDPSERIRARHPPRLCFKRRASRPYSTVPVHACGASAVDPCLAMQPQCSNQSDDDGNGLRDYPFDPGCSSPDDPTERTLGSWPACAEGVDKDEDGTTDFPDEPDCHAAMGRSEDDPTCGDLNIPVIRIDRDQTVVNGRLDRDSTSTLAGSCGGRTGREAVYALTVTHATTLTVHLEESDFEGVVYVLPGAQRN